MKRNCGEGRKTGSFFFNADLERDTGPSCKSATFSRTALFSSAVAGRLMAQQTRCTSAEKKNTMTQQILQIMTALGKRKHACMRGINDMQADKSASACKRTDKSIYL